MSPIRLARLFLFLLFLPGLGGCYSVISLTEDPTFDAEGFQARSPHTMALAPFTNNSSYSNAGERMRTTMYSVLAPLPFADIELNKVDSFINSKAEERNVRPEALDPYYIADPALADMVVFAEVEKVSRLFFLLYAQIKIEMRMVAVDTSTRTKLYQNHFVVTNRNFSVPVSLPGIVTSMVSTGSFMRESELNDSMEEAAEKIAERFPRPATLATDGSTTIEQVEVAVARQTLKTGDRIMIHAKGSAGRSAAFSIGKVAVNQPMVETSPGDYSGVHTVKDKDDGRFLFVSVTFTNPRKAGETVTLQANEQPFAIDTVPPPSYVVDSWVRRQGVSGVLLRFAPEDRAAAGTAETPKLFHVFRAENKGGNLVFIGTSEAPEYDDKDAKEGVPYEYGVTTEDAAGNTGPMKAPTAIRLEPGAAPAGTR